MLISTGWLQYHVHMVAALGAPMTVDVTPTPIQHQNTAIFAVVPQGSYYVDVFCRCISVEDRPKYSDPILYSDLYTSCNNKFVLTVTNPRIFSLVCIRTFFCCRFFLLTCIYPGHERGVFYGGCGICLIHVGVWSVFLVC
jgi:hypothetical protein